MKLFVSATLAFFLSLAPSLAWAESSLFSGFELFTGIKLNGVTIGATFSGWTDSATREIWVPFSQSTGGFVTGNINYTSSPGFGRSVTIVGGQWSWLEADNHTVHSGRVLSGNVKWPPNVQTPVGTVSGVDCGDGVATFIAKVRDASSSTNGTISGCLDDQLIFPPKIWGDVNLPSVP